jgi:hypothetical protein
MIRVKAVRPRGPGRLLRPYNARARLLVPCDLPFRPQPRGTLFSPVKGTGAQLPALQLQIVTRSAFRGA